MEPTFYEILEVAEQVDVATLKKAYRRQAQRLHPDRNPGDLFAAARFQRLQEAWKVLSDPIQRRDYDLVLRQRYQSEEVVYTQETPPPSTIDEGWMGSIKNWFKKPRTEWDPHGPGGYHIHIKMPLSLNEAWQGTRKPINVRVAHTCPRCLGKTKSCSQCGGTGQVFEARRFQVEIPKGAQPGQILRLFEQGHSGPFTQSAGDILVKLDFEIPYPWHFEGVNLVRPYFLKQDEADLGGKFPFKGINGSSGTFAVPGLLKTGQPIRLRGQGWMTSSGERSDAWLVIRIRET